MTKEERKKRILAYGEHSGHMHCVVGDITFDQKGRIIVGEDSNAVLRHLIEKDWVEEEKQTWTGEHTDIKLTPGVYEYVSQMVFDPLSKRIESAKD